MGTGSETGQGGRTAATLFAIVGRKFEQSSIRVEADQNCGDNKKLFKHLFVHLLFNMLTAKGE